MSQILIRFSSTCLQATLNESKTAQAIRQGLPTTAHVHRWGDEIYFPVDVTPTPDPNAREVLEIGELAYWPPGHMFCIFFGPTPASHENEPRAASPVHVIGRILDDPESLQPIQDGEEVKLEKSDRKPD